MVDALCRISRWLKPDGTLIDLRPAELIPTVEVVGAGDAPVRIGELVVQDERRQRHVAADRALDAVLARHVFVLEQSRQFTFLRYAESAEELCNYVAAKWQHTRVDEATRRRAADALHGRPGARVAIRELVGIRKLRLSAPLDGALTSL